MSELICAGCGATIDISGLEPAMGERNYSAFVVDEHLPFSKQNRP